MIFRDRGSTAGWGLLVLLRSILTNLYRDRRQPYRLPRAAPRAGERAGRGIPVRNAGQGARLPPVAISLFVGGTIGTRALSTLKSAVKRNQVFSPTPRTKARKFPQRNHLAPAFLHLPMAGLMSRKFLAFSL
jgi:hypothetical protein